ncbi:hypothetical protein N185_15820 [Sinorhizobium sp. GW3]|nr:hypothetical protein N185_15820 [Sinorhizobium sp. GW3]
MLPNHTSCSVEGRRDAGFTLLEVLVALSVIAMLSLITASLMSQLHSLETARRKNDTILEIETLAGFIEQSVRNARPLPLTRDNPQQRLLMRGDAQSISFVAVTRVGGTGNSLRELRVFLGRQAGGRARLMQATSLRRIGDETQLDSVELAEVDGIRFRYWGRGDGDTEPNGWRDTWMMPGRLPEAVSVELSVTRSGQTVSAHRTVKLIASHDQ